MIDFVRAKIFFSDMIWIGLLLVAPGATLNEEAFHDSIAACLFLERMSRRRGLSTTRREAKEDTEKLAQKTLDVLKFGLFDTARLKRVVEVVEKIVNLVALWLWQASTEEGAYFEDYGNGYIDELSLLVGDLGAHEEAELKRFKGGQVDF